MSLRAIRNAGLGSIRAAGLFSLAANSASRRGRLLILCYHGISLDDEDRWRGHLYISPELFRKRLESLRSFGANVLALDEAVDRLLKGSLPPRSVVITFDDGFYDFHRHALPLLQEFGYPATVYLTTYYCRHSWPIFNLMADYLLWKSGREWIELPGFGITGPIPIRNQDEHQKVVQHLVKWADERQVNKDEIARQVAETAGLDYDAILATRKLQLMNPQEVAEVSRFGIGIELHTHRHRTPRDRDLFVREIVDNSVCIQDITGTKPTHFCYPSGDYDPLFFPWLGDCGVRSATTCQGGLAAAQSEPLLLPRMLDDSFASQVQFERWLSGFWL